MTPTLNPRPARRRKSFENKGFQAQGLNDRQKQAALAPERPLLIVAGAGTGKTRTLTTRILHLISTGVPPEEICAMTFTNKAAREMRGRVLAGLPEGSLRPGREPFLGTFHSLGAKILRAEPKLTGRSRGFVIFDEHDANQVVKKLIRGLPLLKEGSSPSTFLRQISALKNGSLTRDELLNSRNPNSRLVPQVYDAYEKVLYDSNAFDFDDLLVKVVDIFHADQDILQKYRDRYRHLLVDEYQDINNVQYELIRLLAGPSGRLSVVGDDQQTIYSWRGSNFEIFLDFEKDWPEAQIVVLDQNYRSTRNIISAASAVIAHNLKQRPKKLWTEAEAGEMVRLVETASEDDEALWLADQLVKLKPGERRETAVLYRTNAQSRAIEQELIARNIPYRIYGGIKFYERKEIKDILAALRYVLNPKDIVSYERLEKGIGKVRARALLQKLGDTSAASPVELIHSILEATDYFAQLDRNYQNSVERRENIAELAYFADKFDSVPEFLEQVSLLQSADSIRQGDASRGPEVQLLTIHLAKGLEFDRVFVVGCTEGLLPHAFSIDTQEDVEEERRLMYVAMTRARHELCLSFYDIPSRFLSEIPAEYVAYESLVSDDRFFSDDEERYITLD